MLKNIKIYIVMLAMLCFASAFAHDDGTVHDEPGDDSRSREVELVPIRMNVQVDDIKMDNAKHKSTSKSITRDDKITTTTTYTATSTNTSVSTSSEQEQILERGKEHRSESKIKSAYKKAKERVGNFFKNIFNRFNN